MDIGMGILDRISHSRLRAEMDDAIEVAPVESPLQRLVVGEIDLDEIEAVMAPCQLGEPGALQRDAVIIVHIVDADHLLAPREQALAQVEADEAGGAGYDYGHS